MATKRAQPKKKKEKKTAAALPKVELLELDAARDGSLDALIDNPDSRDACLAYATWLQSHSHPLGEVIALALAAEKEPPRQRKLKVQATAALVRNIEEQLVPR